MKTKKVLMMLAAASIAVCAFAQKESQNPYDAVSDGLATKKVSVGMIENPTPENSVLVYGACEAGAILWYQDRNSNWEKIVESNMMSFILPPVHKGADMRLKQGGFFMHEVAGTKRYQTRDTWYPITNNEWNFKAPKDKSLLFLGYHSILMPGSNTYEGMKAAFEKYKSENLVIGGAPKTQEEYDKFIAKLELSILKKLLKQYKGTDWEPVINERIAEVNEVLKKK